MQGSNLWCGGSPTKKHKSRLLNPRKSETQKRSWEIDHWILDFGSGTTKNGQSLSRQCSHAPVRVKSVSHRSNLAGKRKLQWCLHGVLSVTFPGKCPLVHSDSLQHWKKTYDRHTPKDCCLDYVASVYIETCKRKTCSCKIVLSEILRNLQNYCVLKTMLCFLK
jgi:hypothetical protein